MGEQFEAVHRNLRDRIEYMKNDSRSEAGLFLKVMDKVFTVVNKIEPVVSNKPLEIFYYAPVNDDSVLGAVKDCICLTWLENNPHPRRYDFPQTGHRASMSAGISHLPIKWEPFPTQVNRDKLALLGINCITAYMRLRLCLEGAVIWRNGQLVQPATFPPHWSELATMATLAEQITYADILRLENPQWQ